ncbi:hypothetical protein COCSUDRAFT_47105 [Coccomyxa subellipsoidea C-169]|uniref:SANT domain-containing protein n=1 Tax=Coccomyxa subellipsoidea (strain C-169) TaxID=574566 RepID=I0Z053_COCSC|nr:hypothetical protein COCSUDRAFT_47105 [Coccomyxa subellipsoidea C-169]EIE24022.1 hypothetical protein COCSUDRAFT_47105 [Coccomyxa subellipsoidea C-169]|eukprot:XP_005648566.1 hypothetical protein COCSUDRAFT_47105 [Coccomyxa subellipsoidea C-169]
MGQTGSGISSMEPDRGGQQKAESAGTAQPDTAAPDLAPETTGRPKRKPSTAPGKRKKVLRHASSSPPNDRTAKRRAFEHPLPAGLISQPPVTDGGAPTKEPGEKVRGGAAAVAAAGHDSEDSFALHFSTDDEQEEALFGPDARGRGKARNRQGKPSRVKRSGSGEQARTGGMSGMQGCQVRPPRGSVSQQPVPSVSVSPRATWPLKGYSSSPQLVGMVDLVQWLRGTASTGGRATAPPCVGPAETAPPEWQPAAVERRYRAALARARAVTRVAPADAADEAAGIRRSGRARQTPDAFVPGLDSPGLRNRGRRVVEKPDAAGEGEDDDGPPELLEGDEYQAVLPQQRPRPKRPTAEEARWLQHRLLAPGAWGDPSRRVRILSSTDASGRRFKQTETGAAISGQLQRDLGLVDSLPEWSQREIDIFEAVLTRDGKDMDLIASQLAPEKCVGDVVRFYFCSWKGRLLPQAQLWYERRKQEKQRAEEAEKVEETAAGVAVQRKAGVVRAERRRQLKNALLWQRDSMRTPLDLNTTRVKILERLVRARDVLVANALPKFNASTLTEHREQKMKS